MIDLLIPARPADDDLAASCVRTFSGKVGAPHRVILGTCGVRDDFTHSVRAAMAVNDDPQAFGDILWLRQHEAEVMGYGPMIERMVKSTSDLRALYAVIPSNAEMMDKDWFAKVNRVFSVDPQCAMLAIPFGSKSGTMHPNRIAKIGGAMESSVLVMRRDLVPMDVDWNAGDLYKEVGTKVLRNSLKVWCHGGIPFVCHARSEAPPAKLGWL